MEYTIFDADQHYYEAEDCLTRFASARMQSEKYVRWLTEADGKRKRLIIGKQLVDVIGNPTFNPIAPPGILHDLLKNMETGAARGAVRFDNVEPIRPEYRDRDVRLKVMSDQGVGRTLLFPTLAVTLEGYFADDIDLMYDAIHAFNRWLEDDWGFAHAGRIYSAGYICLMDVTRAIAELEWLLKAGARAITIRPGPPYGRSPGDPHFDPFWARVEEAEVLVTYHAFDGPSLESAAFRQLWRAPPQGMTPEYHLLEHTVAGHDKFAMDTFTAMVLHNLFGRFPKLRVASIEMGCGWVDYMLKRLDHAGGLANRKITAFGEVLKDRPSDIFKRHVWVSPFPEEDVVGLARSIGADRVLMGSDWPHIESVPNPKDYVNCLEGLSEADKIGIMGENAAALIAA
jgi:predicted TIM-barrel fold metal-dependent hydrolase